MNILVLTNHLADYAGSETVAIEVASTFRSLGHDVHIVASHFGEPLRSYLTDNNFNFSKMSDCPQLNSFDIIWSQHQVLPAILANQNVDILKDTFLMTVSLSPYEDLEMPGSIAEISDTVIANSHETAQKLIDYGIDKEKIKIFYNAAPDAYRLDGNAKTKLQKILIISNHAPQELQDASELLRDNGIEVDHLGSHHNKKKITPEYIADYDAIISIGKSVQYAILAEIPVYNYDHFGGPGWLRLQNVDLAEQFNYSGRCCHRKLTSKEIADELLDGFNDACKDILEMKQTHLDKYSLNHFLKKIIEVDYKKPRVNKQDIKLNNIIKRDGFLANGLSKYYNHIIQQNIHIHEANGRAYEAELRTIDAQERAAQEGIKALEAEERAAKECIKALEAEERAAKECIKALEVEEQANKKQKLNDDLNVKIQKMYKFSQSRSWLFKRYIQYLRYVPRDISLKLRGKPAPKKDIPIEGVDDLDLDVN